MYELTDQKKKTQKFGRPKMESTEEAKQPHLSHSHECHKPFPLK